jgi:hypothetical protein
MTETEFISWLGGYLEGVSYDATKPNPVVQTILDKITLLKHTKSMEKITNDPDKVINVPADYPFKDNRWQHPYIVTCTNDKQILKG